MTAEPDNPALSYEEALARAESLVADLEQGKIGLEKTAETYEEASRLLRYCQSILNQLEMKIQKIQVAENGEVSTTPMRLPAGGQGDGN